MYIHEYWFSVSPEIKCHIMKVQWSIYSVNCSMMIWTNQSQVLKIIYTTTAKPLDVMSMTEIVVVFWSRMP